MPRMKVIVRDPDQKYAAAAQNAYRGWRCFELARYLATQIIGTRTRSGYRRSDAIESVVKPATPIAITLSKYKRPFVYDPGPRPVERGGATIGDFLRDLKFLNRQIHAATIVRFVGAVEEYIRGWTFLEGKRRLADAKAKISSTSALEKVIDRIKRDPFYSPSLASLCKLFPDVAEVLALSQHVADEEGADPGEGLDLFSVMQMWREVRNVVIHHSGIVHKGFMASDSGAKVFDALHEHAFSRKGRNPPKGYARAAASPLRRGLGFHIHKL